MPYNVIVLFVTVLTFQFKKVTCSILFIAIKNAFAKFIVKKRYMSYKYLIVWNTKTKETLKNSNSADLFFRQVEDI